MWKKLAGRLLTLVWVALATLAGLEIAVRIWGFSERHIYDSIYMPFERPEEIAYVHKPNLSQARARGLAIINTDSLGLRSKTTGTIHGPKPAGELRIALVGDSYTFGEGVVRTEDTFAQVLEDTLNQRQKGLRVKVFNFGASAYSVKEMAATLKLRTSAIEPDFVIMSIIPDDFNLPRTPWVDSSGHLLNGRLSTLTGPFEFARDTFRHVRLSYVAREILIRHVLTGGPAKAKDGQKIPASYPYLLDFQREANRQNLGRVIVLLPSGSRLWGILPAQLSRDQLPYLDLSPLKEQFTAAQYQASSFDGHPSAAVHRRIGVALADYLEQNSPVLRAHSGRP